MGMRRGQGGLGGERERERKKEKEQERTRKKEKERERKIKNEKERERKRKKEKERERKRKKEKETQQRPNNRHAEKTGGDWETLAGIVFEHGSGRAWVKPGRPDDEAEPWFVLTPGGGKEEIPEACRCARAEAEGEFLIRKIDLSTYFCVNWIPGYSHPPQ